MRHDRIEPEDAGWMVAEFRQNAHHNLNSWCNWLSENEAKQWLDAIADVVNAADKGVDVTDRVREIVTKAINAAAEQYDLDLSENVA